MPKKMKKAKKEEVKAAPTKKAAEKEEKKPPEERLLHILMPYFLGILSIFLALCFLLGEEKLGYFGKISLILQGLFSAGAFAVPFCLLIHAVFYRRDLSVGSYLYKFWFTLFVSVSLGAMTSLIQQKEVILDPRILFSQGITLSGGGVFGGWFYALLQKTVGVFTPVILCIFLGLFVSFLFGTTPADLLRNLFSALANKFRSGKEERLLRQEEEKKRREEEKLRLAQLRAQEKYQIREETEKKKSARQLKKEAQCDANFYSDDGLEPCREDFVSDDEVNIRLPGEEAKREARRLQEEEQAAKEREFVAIENIESEPVPDLHQEIQDIFKEPTLAEKEVPSQELDRDLTHAETDISLNEKDAEEKWDQKKETIETETGEEIQKEYVFPPLSLLHKPNPTRAASQQEQDQTAKKLVETLSSFGVKTSICGIAKGPAVTRYELQPQPGVRVRSIVNLTDDIALSLASGGVRIEAPIPGKEAVGIEVPNRERETVYVRELIERDEFRENPSRLHCCLGKDVAGKPIFCDLSKMPHILIAGATGMGKSVCLNSLLVSILYHASPEEVQLILIDPKKVEMGVYNKIPHLIVPVVSDSKKAAGALNWAVIEMEKRFIEMEEVGVRDIKHYNQLTANDPDKRMMSHIVIIIDELADLMMTARDEVETSICRLAQKARAAGMHLVIGTQRPSVDVITGLIKSNIPSRIACTVASQVDSRTIIDIQGAEKLMGKGDMLYAPVGAMKPMRVQGCFVGEKEIEAVCDFIRSQREANYDESVSNLIEREAGKVGEKKRGMVFSEEAGAAGGLSVFTDKDPLLEKAIDVAVSEKKVATSLLQRRLSVGYARAAKLIDYMEELHVVGPYAGSKPREVLWTEQYLAEYKMRALEGQPID